MKATDNQPVILASTGASGARLAISFLGILLKSSVRQVHFVHSEAFGDVFSVEEGGSLEKALGALKCGKLRVFSDSDLSAPASSGSFLHSGMVVMPASMASVGAIASGAGDGLVHRAADVCLKEGRRLVVCPRETPFSLIHLRNMVALKEAGAVILPFIPQYYTKPKTLKEIENHFFQRILDHLGVETPLSKRWE